MEKIKVSAVSYINTRPFLNGLETSGLIEQIELSLDVPSEGARKFINGETDVALIPVAILPAVPDAHIITDYCIGSNGPVGTVCIFSHRPLDQVDKIYLDPQSRTSVQLCRLLVREHWDLDIEFIEGKPGYEEGLDEESAALIIGDRAMIYNEAFRYVTDLGEAWTEWTHLPFVYAVWASRLDPNNMFGAALNKALKEGVEALHAIEFERTYEKFDVFHYLTENIKYDLDESKMEGLELFLNKLGHRMTVKQ